MSKPRDNTTFEKRRKEHLNKKISKSKGKIQEKVIHFRNGDVPKFLRDIDKFEKQSRKSRIVIK